MPRKAPAVPRDIRLMTWIELSYLRAMDVLPESFEKARIGLDEATPIHDVNGEPLFWRTPLAHSRADAGYVDVAVHPAFGERLIAVSSGAWDAAALQKAGISAARERGIRGAEAADVRFVAYSFPKIALQFLVQRREVAMLELHTWEPVPPSARGSRYEPPSNFERWSFLDEMPDDARTERSERFERRTRRLRDAFRRPPKDVAVIDSRTFLDRAKLDRLRLVWSRELHYSTRNADHFACYELRGQETNVWCVAASVQMLLDFYRYEYTQVRLAQELGLGTLANPNGLSYARIGDVVTTIEALTLNALDVSMNTSPNFGEFVSEISANRPLISFIPGHSRTVAGFTRSFLSLFGLPPFRGLLVYDPWPPNAGVVTRWENFDASTYFVTYAAVLQKG